MTNLEKVKNHLLSGGYIQVSTYLKSRPYESKHIDMFGEDFQGFLTVKHGKHVDSLKYANIKFLRMVNHG